METEIIRDSESAHAYGVARAEAGASAAEMLRDLLARGADANMLVGAVAGWEEQRRQRREQWLSFLVHDLKNPLNTVLNALWLLRSKLADRDDVAKLLGMVERAARKIEEGLGDVRELERNHVAGAPQRTR
jgi:signal transduction histidine kinase